MIDTLSLGEVRKASKALKAGGLRLPACGLVITLPDGRILAHDAGGYYWVRREPGGTNFSRLDAY